MSLNERKKIQNNRIIKINKLQSLKLFLMKTFSCCIFKFKQNKLKRLYETGIEKIDKELDIVKIIKALRSLKIFYKDRVKKIDRVLLNNHEENIIDIDTPS